MDLDSGNQSSDFQVAWAAQRVSYFSVSALAALLWDVLTSLNDECALIWPKPNRSYIKWLFILSRYFAVITQIGHQFMLHWFYKNAPVPPQTCRPWYTYQAIALQVMMVIVQVITMLRVHALYNRSRWMAIVLTLLLVTQWILTWIGSTRVLDRLAYTDVCTVRKAPIEVVYFGVGTIACQSAVFILTCARHIAATHSGIGRSPLVSLVIRDGTGVYVVILALLGMTISYAIVNNVVADIVFYWFITILSSTGCHVILNMQRLGRTRSQEETAVELTTGLFDWTYTDEKGSGDVS